MIKLDLPDEFLMKYKRKIFSFTKSRIVPNSLAYTEITSGHVFGSEVIPKPYRSCVLA